MPRRNRQIDTPKFFGTVGCDYQQTVAGKTVVLDWRDRPLLNSLGESEMGEVVVIHNGREYALMDIMASRLGLELPLRVANGNPYDLRRRNVVGYSLERENPKWLAQFLASEAAAGNVYEEVRHRRYG